MTAVGLGVARVAYLGLAGAAFFLAASLANPREMGIFAIASAYAAIATVALNFGIDRMVLIRVASSPGHPVLKPLMRVRSWPTGLLLVSGSVVAVLRPELLGAVFIVFSRIVLNDLEAVALGRGFDTSVASATLANGVVTAVGMVLAAPIGYPLLLWASALGNLVAAVLLARGPRPRSADDLPAISWRDCWPFGLMALVGVIYLRCGMAVLAPRGIPTLAVASFAVAFKAFEVLVALRGALVQRAATKVIHRGDDYPIVEKFSRQLLLLSLLFGAAGILGSGMCAHFGVLPAYPDVWRLVAEVSAAAPLVMSHGVTSALIFSRRGSATTFFDSCALAALALGAVTVAAGINVEMVMWVTCAMEFISFCVFAARFRRVWAAGPWTVAWPLAAAGALLPLWVVTL